MTEHLPPQNLDMEEAALGAALMSPAALALLLAGAPADAFYRASHRLIYEAMRHLTEEGTGVDEQTVAARLERMPAPKDDQQNTTAAQVVGGKVALYTLAQRVPAIANARAYIEEVVNTYRLRLLVHAGHELARTAYESGDVDEALRSAEELVLGARSQDPAALRKGTSMRALVEEFRDSYGMAAETPHLQPLSFRRAKMDADLGGMYPGDVIACGGYTKHGKSFEALDITEGCVMGGQRAAYFTAELTRKDITRRLVAMGGYDLAKLRNETLPLPVFRERLEQVESWPLEVFDGTITVGRIRAECARAAMMGNPYRLVVIDHFHLMKWAGRASERREHQEDGLRELKAIAVEYGLTILVLCQLNESESKQGEPYPVPTNRSWRDTRAIPNISDVAYFVWQDNDGGIYSGDAYLVVTLARNSAERPKVLAPFNKRTLRFREPERHEPQQQHLRPADTTESPGMRQLASTFGAVVVNPDGSETTIV